MLLNVSLLLSLFEQKTPQTTNSLKENEKRGNICIIREMSSLNKCLNYFFSTAYKKVKQADWSGI